MRIIEKAGMRLKYRVTCRVVISHLVNPRIATNRKPTMKYSAQDVVKICAMPNSLFLRIDRVYNAQIRITCGLPKNQIRDF